MSIITGLGLNVWNDYQEENENWKMAIYCDYNGETDTSDWVSIEATPDRIKRYKEISQDDDWWVYDQHHDFYYILWGKRGKRS